MNEHATSVIIHPGQPMPDIMARVTDPGEPGEYGEGAQAAELAYAYWSLGLSDQYKETYINHDTALTFSAVWACVRIISQSLAGVGWHVYEKSMDGRKKMPIEDDVAWTLDMQANPEMSAFEWRQVMLKDALTWGNGYAEIERTMGGRFLWLWRIAPERVELIRDEEGQLWYEIDNKGRTKTYLRPENVFHLRGLGPDGLVGWSVIEMARKAIQLGLYEEKFGLQFFRRGPMPGGFLTLPKSMTEQQRRETRRSFEELYSGSQNAHRVVVLSDGMTFDPASMPNEDAQFLQSRTFQINEICRWFGVPPHKVSEMSRATFSNIEEQNIEFVTDCLLAWASRLESEANIKCYTQRRQGRRYTRLNLDALMRGNSETQTSTVTQKVSGGIFTPNEGREYFDLNPVPEGDVLMVQGAMIPLERAIEEPPEPAEPAPGVEPAMPEPSQNGNGDTTAPTNRFEALSLVTSTANGFKLADALTAFDPDQERDDHGRFGSGGGGDSADKTDGKDGGKADQAQTEREAQREAEDSKIEDQRISEDAKTDDERQNEEAKVDEERSAEDARLEREEIDREAEREKEDEQRDVQREKQDNQLQDDRQVEDDKIGADRDSTDEKTDAVREAEDNAVDDRFDRDEITQEQRIAEHARNTEARDKEDEKRDTVRDREDTKRDTEREKADARIEKDREKEDAARDKAREQEDKQSEKAASQREKEREKQDRDREKRWDAEDKQREAVREKEDRDRERQRASEDRGAK